VSATALRIAKSPSEVALPPIIMDLSLLLTPWGPWLVQHLSQLASVWLPRALVRLRAGEALLMDDGIDKNVLDLWQDCWSDLVQKPRVHWFDQNLIPSHAPKGESPALLDRLNNLAAELQGRMRGEFRLQDIEPFSLMLEGVITAIALAAVLPGEAPVVLCRLEDDKAEPCFCSALQRFDLTPHRLADETLSEALSGRLFGGLVQAGLAPLLGTATVRFAAVYLAMPRSVLPLPPASSAPPMLDTEEPSEEDLRLNNVSLMIEEGKGPFWDDALVIWHEVR
jgi:hypothetical protein